MLDSVTRSLKLQRWSINGRTVMTLIVVGLLVYLILGPTLMLLFSTFKETEGTLPFEANVPWTLGNYAQVFLESSTYVVLSNTLLFAAASLVLSFSMAFGLAWLVERTDLPFRNMLFVVVIASIGIPSVIAGIAWVLLGNPVNGIVNIALRTIFNLDAPGPLNVYSLPGLIFVQALTMVPITFLLITAALRVMDPTLEDAASAAGAPFRVVMRRITIPMLTPAILSALVFQFVTVVESFDLPLIIGIPVGIRLLSTQVYLETRPTVGLPDYGVAATYSVLLLCLALGPLLVYNRVMGRGERYATVTSRGYHPRRFSLGPWKYPALAIAIAYLVAAFLLPVLTMVWTSLQPFYAPPSAESIARITFDAYVDLVENPFVVEALLNTVLLGTATGLGTMVLGVLVAWILVRSRSRLRPVLDGLAFMPHAFPGVIIGLSILLIYLLLPLPIYGTIWIIVLAIMTQEITIATRLMSTAIVQVKRELEEAAETSGAGWFLTLRRIVAPLILPAFLNGFLLIFVAAIKNLTLALILFSENSVLLSTLVWLSWTQFGDTALTGALGTVMVLMTVLTGFIARRLSLMGLARL